MVGKPISLPAHHVHSLPAHVHAPRISHQHLIHGSNTWLAAFLPGCSPAQCGKLEPLDLFDGHKRSCRVQLAKRRAASSSKLSQASTPRSSASGDTAANSLRPMRAGVRKAVTCNSMDAFMQRVQQQQQQRQQHAEVNSRLLSLQQQLLELESHVGLITQQQHARNRLAFMQRQYDTLLLEAVALQRQQQQQHLLQGLEQPLDMPFVNTAAAVGGYAAGGLSMAALASTPVLPAVFVAPAASGVVPFVLPGAAVGAAASAAVGGLAAGAPAGLLLPSAPAAAAAASGFGQGAMVGMPIEASLASLQARLTRALSTGLGLGMQTQQGSMQPGLQQLSCSISSGSSGNAHAERSSLVRFHSLSNSNGALAAAAAAAEGAAGAGDAGATAAAAAVAAGREHAALQGPFQQGPSDQDWENFLLGDIPDLHELLAGDHGDLHPGSEQQRTALSQPRVFPNHEHYAGSPHALQQVQPALHGVQDSYSHAAANAAAAGGSSFGAAQHQMLLSAQQPPQMLAAHSQHPAAAVGMAMPAAAGVGGLQPCGGMQQFFPPAVQQNGMVGFEGSHDFAGKVNSVSCTGVGVQFGLHADGAPVALVHEKAALLTTRCLC